MKKAEQMIGPDFFRNVVKEAKKDIKQPKKGDDDLLLQMGQSDAWSLLETIVEQMTATMEKRAKQLAGKAKTWEEVGKVYFAKEIAIDSMQSVLDIVNLRKEADDAQPAEE